MAIPVPVVQFELPEVLFVKVIVGLLLLMSVTVKFLVVSLIDKVTGPEIWELTENFASPFCVVTVVGRLFPLTFVFESPETREIEIVSLTGAKLTLQSRMSTINVTEPVFVVTGGLG